MVDLPMNALNDWMPPVFDRDGPLRPGDLAAERVALGLYPKLKFDHRPQLPDIFNKGTDHVLKNLALLARLRRHQTKQREAD